MLPSTLELARASTKSDWLVRDSFIKLLVNVIESGGVGTAREFVIDFLSSMFRDAIHCIAVYELKEELEKRGAHCIITILHNTVDLIVVSSKATYFVEVKTHGPPWRGNNIKEYLEYKKLPGPIIYAWKEKGGWRYAWLEELILDVDKVIALRSHPIDELEI